MKMTDIMKKSHSESKSENLDAILQKIDNKAFITNSDRKSTRLNSSHHRIGDGRVWV